jgi:hypothetical protein
MLRQLVARQWLQSSDNCRIPKRRRPGPLGFLQVIPASLVAGCTGLEPVASGVTGRRYNRLN